MRVYIYKMISIPKRHDRGDKRDAGDGVEVWEMRQNEMRRSKYHYEERKSDR